MRKLGTLDLEILHLAIKKNGTFNESDLANSELKRFTVGRLLDCLAELKDKKFLALNLDGSFSITDMARKILWDPNASTWTRLLQLLEIKSCSMQQISDVLGIDEDILMHETEQLRKKHYILMSPQIQNNKLVKIYEILDEGMQIINKTEISELKQDNTSLLDEIILDVENSQLVDLQKNTIVEKLHRLKDKLKI